MRNLMLKGAAWAMSHKQREEGQTVIEYALVVVLVSIVLAAALVGFGEDIITAAQTAVETAIPA